uniref:MyoD family inhibitor n=1 Tax=Cyclopterus lumpus TaxID=8103 RepID=A0A8C2XFA9_CYCLU
YATEPSTTHTLLKRTVRITRTPSSPTGSGTEALILSSAPSREAAHPHPRLLQRDPNTPRNYSPTPPSLPRAAKEARAAPRAIALRCPQKHRTKTKWLHQNIFMSNCCVHCILACLFCEFLTLCNIVLDCATCGSCAGDDSCFCCCCASEECGDCDLPCDMDCGIIDACCESADCLEICMECCSLCFSS